MFELDEENKGNPIGAMLRSNRELRKLDLDFVAEQLKIRRDYLSAMEEDRFDLLPKGMYRRSFLRAYANFLRLDPDHILKLFDEQYKEEEEEDQIEARSAWIKAHLGEAKEELKLPKEKLSMQKIASFLKLPFRLSQSGVLVLVSLGIILVVIIIIILLKPGIKKDRNAITGSGLTESGNLRMNSESVDTMKVFMQMVDDSIGKAPEWILRVNAIGECWMNLESDGKRLFSAMVFEKMNLEFKAKDSFTIYSGKNKELRVWLNGFELKSIPNGVTNLNRKNFKEFILTDVAGQRIKTLSPK